MSVEQKNDEARFEHAPRTTTQEVNQPMAEALFIPKLGNTVEEVTLIEWTVANGTGVKLGQELLEIETDKAVFNVEATADGILHHGPFVAGDVLPVLEVVAVIGTVEDSWDSHQASASPTTTAAKEIVAEAVANSVEVEMDIAVAVLPTTQIESSERLFISPRARKLAENKGIDLNALMPTGPNGRIVERDVLAYLEARPSASPVARKMAEEAGINVYDIAGSGPGGRIVRRDVELALAVETVPAPAAAAPAAVAQPPLQLPDAEVSERLPLKGIRGIIADRMGASVHTTARVTIVMEVDATEFVDVRARLKTAVGDSWGFAPGYNDLLALVVAKALREHPHMNARLAADAVEHLAHINLGMAVDTERGLMVPVIRDADQKGLHAFGAEFRELVEKARIGRALPDDLSGGTFTITNLGMYDVDAFTPVINLPEAAILGVGRIAPKPVVVEGEIVVRQMWTLSLVFDHRLVDGAPAARFLQAIKQMIEEPYLLLAN